MDNGVPEICILITNFNTSDFVALSLHALDKLTQGKFNVLINDNGSDDRNLVKLKELEKKYNFVKVFYKKSDRSGSWAHAEALDFLISESDAEYTVILDSDCMPLLKGWDDYLIRMLSGNVKIAGSPLSEGRSGSKPADFPFQFLVVFDTRTYRSLNISTGPLDVNKGKDTCWEWKPKFTSAGYAGSILRTKCTRDFKGGPFKNVICAEYYTDDGKLIGSHFGRGSSGGISKHKNRWFLGTSFVSKLMIQCIARKERKEWMRICRKIIDQQSYLKGRK